MLENATILVVDDSENHRLVISQEMQKLGYKTLVAENGALFHALKHTAHERELVL